MRFWKAGAAAFVLSTAAAVQLSGAETHDQVVRDRDIAEPIERAMQVLTIGPGSRIGVSVEDVSADDVKAKKLASESGVLVVEVQDDMPAARAGLKAGDVIVEFDGERVRSESQLRRLIQETPPGRNVGVVVSRDGQRTTFTVEPEGRRTETSVMPRVETLWRTPRAPRAPRAPAPPQVYRIPTPRVEAPRAPMLDVFPGGFAYSFGGGRLGVTTQRLSEQLARHFGVEQGVLITEVTADSAAAKAGLRAGDVITRVNGDAIADSGDLLREIGAASGEVTIEIVRDRKTQTLKATIEPARTRTLRRII